MEYICEGLGHGLEWLTSILKKGSDYPEELGRVSSLGSSVVVNQ